ncbi:ATP citrate lyase subunit 1 [Blastocladiella emersonii ATCC 22665]|nr:ATP citrate lyase subunit 1 [Blastocladiella emersonii ATCC 22665]
MSAKAIREFHGKHLLAFHLARAPVADSAAVAKAVFDAAASPVANAQLASIVIELPAPTTSADLPEPTSAAPAASAELVPGSTPFASNDARVAAVNRALDRAEALHPWLKAEKLVVKPDMLIKRRGKAGLLGLNLDWAQARAWVLERAGLAIKVEHTTGLLTHFLVERFVPHPSTEEHYICIQANRDGDLIYYSTRGGVDVGDVDEHARRLNVPVLQPYPTAQVHDELLADIADPATRAVVAEFIARLYAVFVDSQFTYLEINPLVVTATGYIHALDLAAKIDQTAEFECGSKWSRALGRAAEFGGLVHRAPPALPGAGAGAGSAPATVEDLTGPAMEFPAPFGRQLTREEAYIAELDAKTGASLKLTILNPEGKIWTMVAGGGASVVYSDAIAALGYAHELANYGEYSGAPSEAQTYEYAKTVLDLMTRGRPRPDGKVLIIGGGIANFTNVASTFKGMTRALREYTKLLQAHGARIFVRRAGPNWQEGLKLVRQLAATLNIEMHVFGPETHITAIVPLALTGTMPSFGVSELDSQNRSSYDPLGAAGNKSTASSPTSESAPKAAANGTGAKVTAGPRGPAHFGGAAAEAHPGSAAAPFSASTRAFVYGMQPRAVQGMLDFDFMCGRKLPSVAAMIYPFGGSHVQKFYWGTQETLVPVYQTVEAAIAQHPDVDTVVNFASCRSVYSSTQDLLRHAQIRTIAIIAEGVPERRARQILHGAKAKGVLIIGPATVGGIKPGCFKIGNTGGMMDNIVASKLYRPGSVAYVSKSGGMSNELNNIISRTTDGVYEGVAIGGDRYPGSTFIDHLLRFEADPDVKVMVLLGEVGGVEEYAIAEAVQRGQITKPVVAWCIGTCASMFATEVQFGHAGALANSDRETAAAKNKALAAAGVHVPATFEEMPALLHRVYSELVRSGAIVPRAEPEVPKIPLDYSWAQELGLIRKPAAFVSTICDDRGQELLYAGMPISDVFKQNIGIGGVVSLLWFKRRLPDYACKFIEMVLMLTADHGPAVSGAHNTIVTARAGKDLVSSICSGLLTIGERFGGALDGAAEQFSQAYDRSLTPREFVDTMRKQNKLILGIGHKIKSRTNPDLRVEIIKEYARKNFPATPILDYAQAVETITTSKKDNLILNVDGAIGVLFVDLLRYSGAFTRDEADEVLRIGTLNGLFVLGRSIGFIGHFLDQKRLKQGLYRHPWDDISYLVGQDESARILASATGN